MIDEKKYRIWKAEKAFLKYDSSDETPVGSLKNISNGRLVKCRDGFLKLLNFEEIK